MKSVDKGVTETLNERSTVADHPAVLDMENPYRGHS